MYHCPDLTVHLDSCPKQETAERELSWVSGQPGPGRLFYNSLGTSPLPPVGLWWLVKGCPASQVYRL